MPITPAQAEQIASALAGAFDRRDLAAIAHADAGVTVELTDDDTAATYAVKLVAKAQRAERLDWLILAALRARPDNAQLTGLVAGALAALFGGKKTLIPVAT